MKRRVIIMGAAGRDFHNFNVYFRDNTDYEVVAFTATQIPDIAGRTYPKELAGRLYPTGIPIHPEDELAQLIAEHKVDIVVFSYSDVSNQYVMERSALVNAAGADFMLLGPRSTMVLPKKPLISITAVRTGSGKSQTTRRVCDILKARGKKLAVIRHPMPYGDLVKQEVQRFETYADLDKHECTIEEREEYEPHIENGTIVYAGIDYEKILRAAEKEADVIIWDGGNNDFSFYKPDLSIVVVDPHRAGHELLYYPSAVNVRMADVIVINKVDTAALDDIQFLRDNVTQLNPHATVIEAASPIQVDNPALIRDKRVLVIEYGPTLTHGGMEYGAGVLAARRFGASEIIDPRPYTVDSISATYRKYPKIGHLLPAMGYGEKQIRDLQKTVDKVECDAVVIGTPIDLGRLLKFKVPATRVRYELQEIGLPNLEQALAAKFPNL
ncbi:MAG: cyclic 2,3-diphosphoglycerate synthase [Candidatus Bipolaricaulota bacterium]|nr:cyclic 2,3-diphosphoglycerate synthase [Candidatus Bipolaricaulota bacterium]